MKPKGKVKRWKRPQLRDGLLQGLVLVVIGLGFVYLGHNLLQKMTVPFGFDFLTTKSGPSIGETLVAYTPTDDIGRAFFVGLLNSLRVMVIGIVLATLWGIIVGLGRLSDNWLVRQLALIYVETIRNFPLLLLLLFLYLGVFLKLPSFERRLILPGPAYLSQNGMALPWFAGNTATLPWLLAWGGSLTIAVWVWRWQVRRQIEQGTRDATLWLPVGIVIIALIIVGLVTRSAPVTRDLPRVIDNLRIEGGLQLSSEFSALLLGLTLYTAAFISEIVRAGINAVAPGQWEAARALGLKPMTILRFVVFPQALRVMVPPLTSQYLNLAKNSSLAVAIGYPDVYYVASASLESTGRTLEIILLLMSVYLTISLTISLAMNLYNRSLQVVER